MGVSAPTQCLSPAREAIQEHLRPTGLAVSAVLVVVYFLINYWTVKAFSHANSFITVFKFAIPALTVAGLIAAGFHSSNFHAHGGFAPNGFSAVLTAVATSGIVFAFNGFQSPVNMAGEARNPSRNVPIAVIGSVLAAAVIYVALQIAFIGAVPAHDLLGGWGSVNFHSPFADLAIALNLNWLAIVLYGDAFVSPSGTGMTYTATTARMIQGMSENGHFPKVFGTLHPRYGVPRPAMWLNLAVSFVFLFMFRGWGTLSAVIGVATVISYVTGPVCVVVLRRTAPDIPRPLRLKGLALLGPAAFILASEALYWSRWPLTGQVILIVALGIPIYLFYQAKAGFSGFGQQVRSGIWLPVYLLWMAALSAAGSTKFGGHGLLPYGWDMMIVAISSLAFYQWGVHSGSFTRAADLVRAGGRTNRWPRPRCSRWAWTPSEAPPGEVPPRAARALRGNRDTAVRHCAFPARHAYAFRLHRGHPSRTVHSSARPRLTPPPSGDGPSQRDGSIGPAGTGGFRASARGALRRIRPLAGPCGHCHVLGGE